MTCWKIRGVFRNLCQLPYSPYPPRAFDPKILTSAVNGAGPDPETSGKDVLPLKTHQYRFALASSLDPYIRLVALLKYQKYLLFSALGHPRPK